MSELSRYLFLAGAVPFVVLGLAHARATPLSRQRRKGLSPADDAVAETMSRTHVLLTRRTDMWRAWVGFNLSHSLGAVLFGSTVLVVGRNAPSYASQVAWFAPLAVAVSGAYLLLAVRYWFRVPIAGCAISVVSFLGAWLTS